MHFIVRQVVIAVFWSDQWILMLLFLRLPHFMLYLFMNCGLRLEWRSTTDKPLLHSNRDPVLVTGDGKKALMIIGFLSGRLALKQQRFVKNWSNVIIERTTGRHASVYPLYFRVLSFAIVPAPVFNRCHTNASDPVVIVLVDMSCICFRILANQVNNLSDKSKLVKVTCVGVFVLFIFATEVG